MKILIAHNAYQRRGGEDASVDNEAELLRRSGHTVELFSVENTTIGSFSRKIDTIVNASYRSEMARAVEQRSRDMRADVVHIHNFFPLLTIAAHEGARRSGAAVVQTLHNYRLMCANGIFLRDGSVCEKCLSGSRLWAIAHRCYRGSLVGSAAVVRMQSRASTAEFRVRNVDRFIALTQFAKSKFVAGGLPEDRIVVKPNVVTWQPSPPELTVGRRGALFVGRLSVEKGLKHLLEAWASLPHIPLLIAGAGPEMELLKAIASPNVSFLGEQTPDQVRSLMQAAECLIVPSICYEGFPVTIAEAYSTGLPVIASRIGSLTEIVEEGVTGHLTNPGDADDISAVVYRFFQRNEFRNMSSGAISAYTSKYSQLENVRLLEEIYSDAINRRNM